MLSPDVIKLSGSKLQIIAHRFSTKFGAGKLGRILAENLPFKHQLPRKSSDTLYHIMCTSVGVIDKSSRYQIVKFVRAEGRKYV